MARREVQWVQLSGGHTLAAYKLVCPVCLTLDLNTDVNTGVTPWVATCTKGHRWDVKEDADA